MLTHTKLGGLLLLATVALACEDARDVAAPDPPLSVDDIPSFRELSRAVASGVVAMPEVGTLKETDTRMQALMSAAASSNSLTFFTNRTGFNAVCSTVPVETFENVNSGGVCSGSATLNSATNDACYSPGAVLPGFTLAPSFAQYVALSPPAFGVPSVVTGPNFFAANTDITFAPSVTGVGFDLVDVFGGSTWQIEAFSASGSEGSTASGGGFVGVFSSTPLIRIEVTPLGGTAAELFDDLAFGQCIIFVDIDIKPGSDPNSLNCNNENVSIAVAILTTDDFDATTVDHTTVTFEGASETHVNKKTNVARRHEEDVDGDGDTDLVLHFRLGATDLDCGSTDGTLTGETFDGQAIEGTDAVRMIDEGGGQA